MKKCIAILIVCLFTKFGFAQEGGKFSTQHVRELWQVCSISFRNLNPGVGPNFYFPVCDCYVDHIRSNYTPKQIVVDNMTKEEYRKLTQDLRDVCNPKKQPGVSFTKLNKKNPLLIGHQQRG